MKYYSKKLGWSKLSLSTMVTTIDSLKKSIHFRPRLCFQIDLGLSSKNLLMHSVDWSNFGRNFSYRNIFRQLSISESVLNLVSLSLREIKVILKPTWKNMKHDIGTTKPVIQKNANFFHWKSQFKFCYEISRCKIFNRSIKKFQKSWGLFKSS